MERKDQLHIKVSSHRRRSSSSPDTSVSPLSGDPNCCRDVFHNWRTSYGRLSDLSNVSEDYALSRTELNATQYLRTWRMRIFQLRGLAMQAELFSQRSERLKSRLLFRIWMKKLKSKDLSDNEPSSSVRNGTSDRAHTAPLTPKRSTRRNLWRNLNSR
jgi:hypothetical protein